MENADVNTTSFLACSGTHTYVLGLQFVSQSGELIGNEAFWKQEKALRRQVGKGANLEQSQWEWRGEDSGRAGQGFRTQRLTGYGTSSEWIQ